MQCKLHALRAASSESCKIPRLSGKFQIHRELLTHLQVNLGAPQSQLCLANQFAADTECAMPRLHGKAINPASHSVVARSHRQRLRHRVRQPKSGCRFAEDTRLSVTVGGDQLAEVRRRLPCRMNLALEPESFPRRPAQQLRQPREHY